MSKFSELNLFSVAYKSVDYGFPGGWVDPFLVGEVAVTEQDAGYHDVGQGDSIAGMNPSFGELTAHYWVWKNLPPVPYVGFCHYRRYFNFFEHPNIAQPKLLAQPSPEVMSIIASEAQFQAALRILKTSDFITTRMYVLNETISQQFCVNHDAAIWREFVAVIREISPAFLVDCLDWLDVSHEFRFYPVFITRWDIFDELCSLLFPVLFELRRRIGEKPFTPGARFQLDRYPAYLSERFMMLYLHARRLRVYGAQLIALEHGA